MRVVYYLFAASLLLAASCQKEYSIEPGGNHSQGGNNPTDTGTYFPTTTGTTWTYQVSAGYNPDTAAFNHVLDSLGLDTISGYGGVAYLDSIFLGNGFPDTSFQLTMTVTGQDTLINQTTYFVLQSNLGPTLVSRSGSNYNFIGLPGVPSLAGLSSLKLTMLEDNQPVGTTWTDSTFLGGLATYFNFSIKAKGLTTVVNGVTYKNVIEVEYTIPFPLPGFNGFATTTDIYFALNVGVIESITPPSLAGISDTVLLTQASVR